LLKELQALADPSLEFFGVGGGDFASIQHSLMGQILNKQTFGTYRWKGSSVNMMNETL
jgi:hypothetical protein